MLFRERFREVVVVTLADVPESRATGSDHGQGAPLALLPLVVGELAIHRSTDDLRDRDVPPFRLGPQSSHLLFSERDLGSDHALMITTALE